MAIATLGTARIDVLVASDAFDIDVTALPARCGFAYFVDSADIDHVNEQRAICKFQKADLIYKQILSVYSEKAGSVSGLKFGDESAKVFAFCSACGGVGTSSMAAAAAVYFAAKNHKTLYLNLEKFGTADAFFSGEGQFDMSDIVFALKSKKTNLSLKLESCVKQDHTGVYFYSQPKVALDIHELNTEDILRLISEIKLTGSYDCIILDVDFAIDKDTLSILRQTHAVVMVSDGSEIANGKTFQAHQALSILEQDNDASIMNRIALVYNKFSNKTGKALEGLNVKNIGGAPRYEHATTSQVVEQLSKMEVFSVIATVGVAVCLLLAMVLTKQGIGLGDIKLLCALALMGGVYTTCGTIFFAMTACAILAVILLVTKKKNMQSALPFGPFIFAGYLVTIFASIY